MKAIHSPNAPKAVGPYVPAQDTGSLVFCSGQLPLDPASGEMITDDIRAATVRALENLQAVLAAAGLTLRHVAKTTVFLTDLNHFAAMNEVYAKFFPENPPARSTIQVAALPKGSPIEIEAIAVRG